jgi:hypothetical protein
MEVHILIYHYVQKSMQKRWIQLSFEVHFQHVEPYNDMKFLKKRTTKYCIHMEFYNEILHI